MNALAVAGCGVLIFALAVGIGMNTSIGGTRSDYNDGSGFLAAVGLGAIAVGLVATLIEWIAP